MPSMDKKTEIVKLALTPGQKDQIERAAKASGLTLAAWVRMVALLASGDE